MDANFTIVAPICFLYDRESNWSARISKELREQFLYGPILDNKSLPELNNVNESKYKQHSQFIELSNKFYDCSYLLMASLVLE